MNKMGNKTKCLFKLPDEEQEEFFDNIKNYPDLKLNWKAILQKNTVVHCPGEQQAIDLLTEADRIGLGWFAGGSLLNNNNWSIFEEHTCYYLRNGIFANIDYFVYRGSNILTYDEILLNKEQII